MSVATVAACLADSSASLLPGMAKLPTFHWMQMEDKIELMALWIEEVQGFDEMRASHNDLLFVQKSMEIEGWLVLVDIQGNVDSMVAASSS